MDARALFRDVLEEARRLGLGPLERLALIIGTAIVIVSFRHLGSALRGISFKVTVERAPEPVSDGGVASDRDLPVAQPDPSPPPREDFGG